MDEITMNYNGNQLTQVDNGSDEDTAYEGVQYHGGNLLTYDENGCLTADLDKNISSIQYNSLNLPTYMRLSTASASIRYQYDSKGNKLQETRISRRPKMRHETSYCGNFVFENKVLKRILVDGGFIYFGENDTTYHYFLKDHLGSNRAVVNQKTGQVVEKYDYYPFGKQHGDYHTGYIHPYRYNGKEMESMMGIDWLYYGARMMEPEWGRFTTPDPMAEKYYHVSPYLYCLNNPMKYVDLDGKAPWILIGAIVGAVIEGGIATYDGKSTREILAATTKGLIDGAVMTIPFANASVAIATSAGVGGIGNIAEQYIGTGEIRANDVVESTISGALSGSNGYITSQMLSRTKIIAERMIEQKYSSKVIKKNIRKEIQTEMKHAGNAISGKSARKTVNSATANRVKILKNAKKTELDFSIKTADYIQQRTNALAADCMVKGIFRNN